MMRRGIILIIGFVLLMSAGCDQSFNPKAVTRDEYVLQCYVQATAGRPSSTVSALLARVYDVDGFDPSVNTNDPSVVGASLRVTVNGREYPMKDSLRFNPDSLRYGSKQHSYYGRMPLPAPSDKISITATLPDGRKLTAQTEAPAIRPVASSFDFPQGINPRMNFPPGVKNWVLSWDNGAATDPHLFFPRLVISYAKMVGSAEVMGTIEVPLKYFAGSKGPTALYPSYTMETSLTFDFAAIDSAMANISAGDPQKSNYGVHGATFVLMEYDTPLSKYYSSVHGSLDQFSVRVDQLVYSNIGGGIGIFGTYFVNQSLFFLDFNYVRSFGYNYR
ncbi:MAG: hypothetical protein NTU47_14390 [Ignavibacteriales bacterium]|nr:hypothetical protein [Ignavibacteriales bacterium]